MKRHQKKYKALDCSSYMGGGAGIFDYIDQLEMAEKAVECDESNV